MSRVLLLSLIFSSLLMITRIGSAVEGQTSPQRAQKAMFDFLNKHIVDERAKIYACQLVLALQGLHGVVGEGFEWTGDTRVSVAHDGTEYYFVQVSHAVYGIGWMDPH